MRQLRGRPGADVDWLPRQADSRSAVRRGRRGGAQRRRPGRRPAIRSAGARQLRRGLDQARPDRLHRHQQVVCGADRAAPGRRLQRRPADRPRRQARRAGQAGAQSAARTWSTPPAGRPSTPRRSPAAATDRPRDKFTTVAEMLAAAATAPTPPDARSGCWPGCGASWAGGELLQIPALMHSPAYSKEHERCFLRRSSRGFGRCPRDRGGGGHRVAGVGVGRDARVRVVVEPTRPTRRRRSRRSPPRTTSPAEPESRR